ncbi:c-type cytochrome [Calycomorphotria hydatis]|uniref:Cytochrome c n=1 Tax=Calycomorphotria hydatis TaxID=2528027 RepID=A0A517T6V9_9PLAN|nr:c-type cytochrome [Calycomorphotria hydatis]QDT64115.1 Cytochrome c [Calycomorphotria hydatis]
MLLVRTSSKRIGSAVLGAIFALCSVCSATALAVDGEVDDFVALPQRGYELLRNKAFLPPDFDEEVIDQVWRMWPETERKVAEQADVETRRQLVFERYGITPSPEDPTTPLGYVVSDDGKWSMNCFACHGGKVLGETIPGLPNSHINLESLTTDVRNTKLQLRKTLSHLDLGSLHIPLGTSRGTTNAVVFGIVLDGIRDADMNVNLTRDTRPHNHHDMDAPPWWHLKKKQRLYIDGFAPKNHRMLVQFTLVTENDRKKIYSFEDDFRHIQAYIESIEPPKYPFSINEELAQRGKLIFENNCAECHGTYGGDWVYPERNIPIDDIGTDRVRYDSLSPKHRAHLKKSWMSNYGADEVIPEPAGYIAPPLDGVWASAPYFHNGSVPTLWHVLHPDQRPKVWKRTEDEYDRERIGLEVEEFSAMPKSAATLHEQRQYFDTSRKGKSAAGHDYPLSLSEDEKTALLEYLKSL